MIDGRIEQKISAGHVPVETFRGDRSKGTYEYEVLIS
jgi:hypothetical protein